MPPSIGLASPWFGPLPAYARYFFHSAAFNPTVDFHVWTDQEAPPALPPNIRWHPTTLPAFVARLENRLGFPLNVRGAYKLCDLKPTYGHCLSEELGDYDFWGVCDLDILWGPLRAFLTLEWLSGVDLASFRGDAFLSGALQVYRRESPATRLFERAPGYRDVLACPEYRGFDEAGLRFDGVVRPVADLAEWGAVVSLTDVAREAQAAGDLRVRTPHWVREPGAWYKAHQYAGTDVVWDRGRLTCVQRQREYLFLHFVSLKKEGLFDFGRLHPLPERFHLRPFGAVRERSVAESAATAAKVVLRPRLAARAAYSAIIARFNLR